MLYARSVLHTLFHSFSVAETVAFRELHGDAPTPGVPEVVLVESPPPSVKDSFTRQSIDRAPGILKALRSSPAMRAWRNTARGVCLQLGDAVWAVPP